ncbi:LacI family DNA-binding transcriptional regulator [Roseobacter sp.]|uniref:LacI family DNA-binding transcriptional regulator n=1 Tax=Roseobacter sp. TaxID=1907202 RepID=UPI0029666EF1|nr:LacI family DNA-binding transcriptional regulator [Roseobacter sp.]MDW3181845.1 LacI family DNA-binding transcriptional regulator [Roseobacter sp.]
MAHDRPLADRAAQPRRRARVTAADVAEAAGVSRSAVSRAFTPGAYLDADKRQLVLKTAMDLGYRPNALAASLQGAATDLVGVVVGELSNPYDSEWLAALVSALNASGKWPIVLGGQAEGLDESVTSILSYPLDALIVRGGSLGEALIDNCTKLNIPVIFSGRVISHPAIDCIACRNHMGMVQAVTLLLESGRRRIGYIGGPPTLSSEQERLAGVVERLAEAGLTLAAQVTSDYSFDGGQSAMRALLQDTSPDAVVCANDAMALGALSFARNCRNLTVPEDLAIIGFDDIAMAAWAEFNLTTVRNPLAKTVDEVLRLLEGRLANPQKPGEVVMIDPDLVKRGTH